jgi:hypothetical protein
MRFSVEIDTNLGEVNIYDTGDFCDDETCGCGTWVGQFLFEEVGDDLRIYEWTMEPWNHRAFRFGVITFLRSYARPRPTNKIFVERSCSDRIWQMLGWEIVGKCELLERSATVCK